MKQIFIFFIWNLIILNTLTIEEDNITIINGDYNTKFNLLENKDYIYLLNSTNYTYLFKSDKSLKDLILYQNKEDGELIECPRICILRKDSYKKIYINKNKNITEDIIITIESGIYLENINLIKSYGKYEENKIFLLSENNLVIYESTVDYIAFFDTEIKAIDIQCLIYKEELSLEDIMTVNPKYFKKDCRGINIINKNDIFLVQMEIRTGIKPVKYLYQPLNLDNEIILNKKANFWDNYLYLKNRNKKYVVNFANNKRKIAIQLSKLTLNSNITIKILDSELGENFLNENNSYYYFKDDNVFKGKLELTVENNDALLQFISQPDSNYQIDFIEYNGKINKRKLTKELTVLKLKGLKTDISNLIEINCKNPSKSTYISGFTNNDLYFHFSSDNTIEKYQKKEVLKQQEIYIPKANLKENEYFYILFILDKSELASNEITLSFTPRLILEDLEEEFSSDNCKYVIGNITEIIKNIYPYEDINKNPPNKEYYKTIDIISELNKINTENRTFYEFYREIRKVLTNLRDGNIRIFISRTPKSLIDLSNVQFLSQINFKIENKQLFIVLVEAVKRKFSLYLERIIQRNINNPIKLINGKNPFDFIQNYGFRYLHNSHAYFTDNMNKLYKYSPMYQPLLDNETIFNIEFIEGDLPLSVKYHFNNLDTFTNSYSLIKGLNQSGINWDIRTDDGVFFCRVDKINQVNVFKQTSFFSKSQKNYEDIIYECFKMFYDNEYPIIGIESNNDNGDAKLSLIFQQLLQIKISNKQYFSSKYTDFMKDYLNKHLDDIINPETCEKFKSIDEITMKEDDYGNNIKHKRTNEFILRDKNVIKDLEIKRKEFSKNEKNIKIPTKILIFTDSYSMNAASILIKGLQETGGAIIVGYNGNPENKDIFDGSQSTTTISNLNDTLYYNNLKNLGYIISGFPLFESFNYTYKSEKVIPREYTIEQVDKRVDIYKSYDDSLYQLFIDTGKNIINDFNNNICNPNNKRLLLDTKECDKIEGIEFAHGGFICGDDGKWSKECKAYYCDSGYYYDTYQNKCIKDVCLIEDNNEESKKKLPVFALVIIIIVSILVLLILSYFIFKYVKKKKNDNDIEKNYKEIIDNLE